MRRAPGWNILLARALELAVPAFLLRAMDTARERRISTKRAAVEEVPAVPTFAQERAAVVPAPGPMTFLSDCADSDARYYRAFDESVELLAGFYADGRVRLADSEDRRFAGMLQNGRAELLELANNSWSELYLRTSPSQEMQLELRGGPYDAHVLRCEALRP